MVNATMFNLEVGKLAIIKNAKIDLKPFTIFFGKNNTGKTYLAYLIYGIGKIGNRVESVKLLDRHDIRFLNIIDLKPLEDSLQKFMEGKFDEIDSYTFEINVDQIYEYSIASKFVSKIFNTSIKCENIKFKFYNMPAKLRINFYIKSIDDIPKEVPIPKFIVEHLRQYFTEIEVKPVLFSFFRSAKDHHFVLGIHFGYRLDKANNLVDLHIFLTPSKKFKKEVSVMKDIKTWIYDGINEILIYYAQDIIGENIKDVIFIPAPKSGIYLLRKALFRKGLEETLEKGEIKIIKEGEADKDISLPLPKPVIDFVKLTLFENLKIDEEFKDLVDFGEKNIIHGFLEYNPEVDEVFYRPRRMKKISIPPQMSSALVVESIPLLTFLRYGIIKKGNLVIIEEPEAHLHPDAQRNLVRLLVRMVNRGIYILLITHSPYVLQQINNCILLHNLDEEKRQKFLKKHGYTTDDKLNPDLVSAYLFELDRWGYSRVKPLKIDEEGIPYDAFFATLMELSKETRELRRLIHEQLEESEG